MKYIGVAQARAQLSQYIEESHEQPVVVLSHGKPAAMLVSLEGYDLEEVALMGNEGFWKMLAERRKPGRKTVALHDLDREVERKAKKRTATSRRRA